MFLMSFLTPAYSTSNSSLDQPSPPSSKGRVKRARLADTNPVTRFSAFQMPVACVSDESMVGNGFLTDLLMLLVPRPMAHRPPLPHNAYVNKACRFKLALIVERTVHRPTGFAVGFVEEFVEADEGAIVRESAVIRDDWENAVLDLDGAARVEVAADVLVCVRVNSLCTY